MGRASDNSRRKVTSLSKLCLLKLTSNHNLLKDIPSISLYYHLIKPVLMKLTKQQLYNLEARDPNLIDMTEDLWFELLKKKFPQEAAGHVGDSTSRDLYLELDSRLDAKRQKAVEKLRRHTKQLESLKNSKQIEIIDHVPSQAQNQATKLHFKSSILQKINKEFATKERKFHHDVKFAQNNKRLKRDGSKVEDNSAGIKRQKSVSSVPMRPVSTRPVSRSKPTPIPTKSNSHSSTTVKKSSIFSKLSGIKGQ